MCFQTIPYRQRGSSRHLRAIRDLTFSIPKNLSLPSSRRGPASSNNLPSGDCGVVLASFFEGDDPIEGLVAPYTSSWRYQPPTQLPSHPSDTAHAMPVIPSNNQPLETFANDYGVVIEKVPLTAPTLNFPKKDVMVAAAHAVERTEAAMPQMGR